MCDERLTTMGDLLKQQQLGTLREISKQLGTLAKIDENTKGLRDIKDALTAISDMVKEFGSMKVELTQMKDDVTVIKNELHKLNNCTSVTEDGDVADQQTLSVQVKSFIDYMIEDRDKNRITSEAYRIRKAYKQTWSNIKNKRKMAYYSALRASSIATIYETFLGKDDIFIPRKFQQKPTPNESETERQRRNSLSIKKMELEIENLKEHALKKENIKDNCETEIRKIVSKSSESEVRQKLMEIWFEEIKMEENTSLAIWEPKQRWFEDMERREKANQHTTEENDEAAEDDTSHTDVTYTGAGQRTYSDAARMRPSNNGPRTYNTRKNANGAGNRTNGGNNMGASDRQGNQHRRTHGQMGRPRNNTPNNNQTGRVDNGGHARQRTAPKQNGGWSRTNDQNGQERNRNNIPRNHHQQPKRQQPNRYQNDEDNFRGDTNRYQNDEDNYHGDTFDEDAIYPDQQPRNHHPRQPQRQQRHYQGGNQRDSFLDSNRRWNRRY